MSEEYRPIEVVDIGGRVTTPGPGRPGRDGTPYSRTEVLLLLLVVGVFLAAAGLAFSAWTTYQGRQDERQLQCAYLASDEGDNQDYDDLDDYQKVIANAFDCDVAGR